MSLVEIFDVARLPFIEVIMMGMLTGIVGALALLHRRIFFTEALTHVTFPGAILGVVVSVFVASLADAGRPQQGFLSVALLLGAVVLCIPLMWLMNFLSRIPGQTSQSSAGIVLTLGFALGYFFNKWYAPLPLNIASFLTGSAINVNSTDAVALGTVLILALLIVFLGYKNLTFYSFDPLGYRAASFSPSVAEFSILFLIAATIVVVIPAVGTILPIALIAAPAASVYPHVRSVNQLLLVTPLLGCLICVSGMIVGILGNISVGGSIAVIAGIIYLGSALIRTLGSRTA